MLAGFIKKIPENIVRIYDKKIMNIHPSLLPKFGGKGFYGMRVHQAVIDSKDKVSGATVHFVDNDYDRGPIILQRSVAVGNSEDSVSLSKKILKIEHIIFPEAVRLFCLGKIKFINNRVKTND